MEQHKEFAGTDSNEIDDGIAFVLGLAFQVLHRLLLGSRVRAFAVAESDGFDSVVDIIGIHIHRRDDRVPVVGIDAEYAVAFKLRVLCGFLLDEDGEFDHVVRIGFIKTIGEEFFERDFLSTVGHQFSFLL